MSQTDIIKVRKVTGEVVDFSIDKLKESLSHSGANQETIERIVNKILRNVYDTISSHEIYKMAFDQLREIRSIYASKYRLKKAIYELGPSGFPFERLVSKIFEKKGYSAEIGNIITGKCVSHEIDVLLHKKKKYAMVECKFHSDDKYICNIKIPLYIHSRFNDLKKNWKKGDVLKNVWIVTNTRFSEEAIHYAKCNNIKLLSWNYPKDNGLKKRINDLGIYPLTTLSLLSGEEKNQLLDQNVVLCSELYKNHYLLNKIGVSKNRKQKIIDEIEELCSIHYTKK